MKSTLTKFLLPLVLLALVCSCEPETTLSIDKTSISIENNGGSQSINISANKDWKCSSDQTWCKVSPTTGTGNGTISISCDANSSFDERSCTVTISSAELTKSISVSQKQGNGLIVAQSLFEINNEEQTIEIEVKSNVNYKYTIDDSCKDWIQYVSAKSLSSSTVTFKIAKNDDYSERTGKITFEQTDGNLKEVVSIKQGEAKGLFVTPTTFDLTKDAQTISVEVKSNIDYEYSIDQECSSWVKVASAKSLSSQTVTFYISENDTEGDRTGKIYFKEKNGALAETVTINQCTSATLLVSTSTYNLSNDLQTITVEVKSNMDYTVQSLADWIEVISTKGLTTSQITLKVAANETSDPRSGEVKISHVSGPASETIIINQAETYGLSVTPDEFQLSNSSQNITFTVQHNVDYDIIIPDDAKSWISEITTKSVSTHEHSFKISANSGAARSTRITIKQKDGPLCEDVAINQSGQSYTVKGQRTVNKAIDYVKGITAVEIDANTMNTISMGLSMAATIPNEKVRVLTMNYPSTDTQGKPVTLSAALLIPDNAFTTTKGRAVKGVVLANRITYLKDAMCPTATNDFLGILAWMNYAVLITDGLGFGASSDYFQSNIDSDMWGRCNVDAMIATEQFLKDYEIKSQDKSWINIGYSQGGFSAIATEKYLAEHNNSSIKISMTIAGGGNYDNNVTFSDFLNSYDFNDLLPIAIVAMIGLNENYKLGIDYADIFKGEMLDNYKEWFLSKKYTRQELTDLFKGHSYDEYFTDAILSQKSEIWDKISAAAERLSVYKGWTPREESKIVVYHSSKDELVTFKNFEHLKDNFNDCSNFIFLEPSEVNHQNGCLEWAKKGINEYWLHLPIF